jgi:hypothetical protein
MIPPAYWSEHVFANVYGAQKSIPPGWESIAGLLYKFKNTCSGYGTEDASLISSVMEF